MIRLFRAIGSILAALVLGSLATLSPSAAAAAPVVAYDYDSPGYGQPTNHTGFERGSPPSARVEVGVGASQGAVDGGSSGTSGRSTASRTTDGYTYDSTVHFAQATDAMTTGPEVVAGSVGDFSPLRRWHVAAKTVPEVAEGSGRLFVTSGRGVTYDIPKGWSQRMADNGKGLVFQRGGATGNADMVRIMEPTAKYPSGYARVYNSHGQPVDVFGRPGPASSTHIPQDYVGQWPGWPQ